MLRTFKIRKLKSPYLPKGISGIALFIFVPALYLTGCETAIVTRPGTQALLEGNAAILDQNDKDQAVNFYTEAYENGDSRVRGQAAYNIAQIAEDKGDIEQSVSYLKQGVQEGHEESASKLAKHYIRTGQNKDEVKHLYYGLTDRYVSANLGLLQLAAEENDHDMATKHARQAESMLAGRVNGYSDTQGSNALMLARLYNDYGQYLGGREQAEQFYIMAMERGNVRAARELGNFWQEPESWQRSNEDIFMVMLQAAKAGDEQAIKYIGNAYETGTGVAQNQAESVRWNSQIPGWTEEKLAQEKKAAQKAANKKNKVAQGPKASDSLRTAQSVMQNAKTQTELQQAGRLFRQAGNGGYLEGQMAADAIEGGSISDLAKNYMGESKDRLYSTARRIDKNYGSRWPDIANRSYRLAAAGGSDKAAYRLAQILETSGGSAKDITSLLEQSANAGNTKAMLLLGRRAQIGQGRPKSETDAFGYYLKAAQAGNAEGQYQSGMAYLRGRGVDKDDDKAKYWLEKAKSSGYALAVEHLKSTGN